MIMIKRTGAVLSYVFPPTVEIPGNTLAILPTYGTQELVPVANIVHGIYPQGGEAAVHVAT